MVREGGHLQGTSPPIGTLDTGWDSAPGAVATAASDTSDVRFALSGGRAELVERAQAGDRHAFEMLLDQAIDRAYRLARAILGNDADASDATQEALVKAWRELPRLRAPERFDAWLRVILVNSCRQALRGRRRRLVREVPVGDPVELMAAYGDPAEAPDDRAAAVDALERAFGRLSVADRTILVLHHLERLPLTDVAATLALPVGTTKSRLFAARRQLEQALKVELR